MKTKTNQLHVSRVILLTGLVMAVGLAQVAPGHFSPLARPGSSSNVLAYATSMSRSDLLAAANQSRSQNGLAPLSLDSRLNNSAQQKAQHMVDNDYWSHVAPDGTQPWYFFEVAGYGYASAGENLAYGFRTSSETNAGWMGSPSHRANILGDYNDVGFGFVNGGSFQGGENTVVVAHYAKPAASPPPAAPKPPQPPTPPPDQPSTLPVSDQSEPPKPQDDQSDAKDQADKKPDSNQPEDSQDIVTAAAQPNNPPPVATGGAAKVTAWQALIAGNLPGRFIISLTIVAVTLLGYMVVHRSLLRQAALHNHSIALHHPTIDAAVIIAGLLIILTSSVAWLQ